MMGVESMLSYWKNDAFVMLCRVAFVDGNILCKAKKICFFAGNLEVIAKLTDN